MSCMSAFGSILRSLTTAAVRTAIIDTIKGSHRHQAPNGTATINAAEAMTAPTAKCWYFVLGNGVEPSDEFIDKSFHIFAVF